MLENDKFYVERCLDGHPDDYRYLVRRYQGVLLANLAGKLGSRDRAEEAAQEALVRAYFNIGKLKKPDSFFSWLLGIADNVAKEHKEKNESNASAILSAHSQKNLPAPNSHRITHSRGQSLNCPRHTGKSSCCDTTASTPATRLQSSSICRWAQ
jgi:DNA-directed RNA polymerase specialized sigma24 family protein